MGLKTVTKQLGIIICTSCLLMMPASLFAQPKQKTPPTDIYQVYADQLNALLKERGIAGEDIRKMLESFKSSKISSDKNFADLLGKLYPADKGIAVLFYFFHADSLTRIFFEPGKIIEKKTIRITKTQLLQLSIDLNYTLDLKKKSAGRAPVPRGFKVKTTVAPTPRINYGTVIKKATNLLLPAAFNERYKHLLIIPALNIGTIPFHLLMPYPDDSLLIDRCSFTIVPGLLDLLTLRTKVLKNNLPEWNGDIDTVFAENPDLNSFDGYSSFRLDNPLLVSNPAYPTNTDYFFPNLPGAKKEIDSVIKYARKKYVLLDSSKAVKDTVIKYLKTADLAYFATHGIADEIKPMEKSFLVLSGKDPFLTAKNLIDLRNNNYYKNEFPEMVILSACQTGLGKSMEAGVAGLARSFLMAGSSFVIMSLWNVDDDATAFLMTRFIFHLQEPHLFMPSEPLRLAILDTRKVYPETTQWAGFSVFGIDL